MVEDIIFYWQISTQDYVCVVDPIRNHEFHIMVY